jgi:hypothetical protein
MSGIYSLLVKSGTTLVDMLHVARDASTVVTLTQVTKVAVTTSMADQADSKVSAARFRGTDLFVRNFEATIFPGS